jgi:hypothetical protein
MKGVTPVSEDRAAAPAAKPPRAVKRRPLRRLAMFGLLAAALSSGGYAAWRAVRQHVVADERYEVTAESVTITPPPEWIRSDVKAEVVRDASLEGPLSILDGNLSQRLYEAFEAHPWVARVERVIKRPPNAVVVELVYRRPVLMVQVPEGLLPVDAEGVQLLTRDFSPLEAARYPRLTDIEVATGPPAGTRWSDPRVAAAARLAAVLIDAWEELSLHRLALANEPSSTPGQLFEFDLFTKDGTRVRWGAAPTAEASEQKLADERLARLKQYYADHGGLEGAPGPQELDLRQTDSRH